MKNLIELILILIVAGSPIFGQDDNTETSLSPSPIDHFLATFERGVINHDRSIVMECMDKEYVKMQHDEVLEGDTEHFLNELLCGNEINGGKFKCIDFDLIDGIKRIDMEKYDDYYSVTYRVSSQGIEIDAGLSVTINSKEGKIVFGIYGGIG